MDLYTGGAEHAVMHLFYSRFFVKALRDMGLVDFSEPFLKLFNQGTVIVDHQKMSKSRGNVINPDHYVSTLGADVVRVYLMFVAPWEQGGDWNDSGISGISRWFNRIWNLALDTYCPTVEMEAEKEKEFERVLHQAIQKVTDDINDIHYNTMISALMELTNYLGKIKESGAVSCSHWNNAIKNVVLMLAPSAPHFAEELWQNLGYPYSIHNQEWPEWDEAKAKDEEVTLVVQINGKVKTRISLPVNISKEGAVQAAMESDKVKSSTAGKTVKDVIYVPGRIVNLVVK